MNESFYEKNLQAIKERTPAFAELIEEDPGVDWVDEIKAESGATNAIIRTTTDPFIMHDKKDPEKEALERAADQPLKNDACSIIFGAGCGYFVSEVLKVMEDRHAVVVVEPVLHILKIALKLHDYSEMISRGSLLFAVTREDIDYQVSLIEQFKSVSNWVIPVENYAIKRPEEYNKLINHTMLLINQLRSNTGTVIGAGKIMADNDISCLPHIIRHRGVADLTDLFKGKPAILISTGPSLQKNIHLLMDKEVQQRFVIIAVGQAFRILLSYDIKPDFICSVDFGPVNMGHYKGLLDTKDVPLVAVNRSYAPILKHWQGPKFISVHLGEVHSESLSAFLNKKGGLLQGGSVSHMNFGLAMALGCDPIIIIGQDLAWDGDKSHNPIADESGKLIKCDDGSVIWEVDDPRSEIKGQHQMGPLQLVNGYFGKAVETNIGLASFISTFERMFRTYGEGTRIINATEGGARLEGIEPMTLQEAIGLTTDPIDKSIIEPLYSLAPDHMDLVNESVKLVTKELEDLEEIITKAGEGLAVTNIMKISKSKSKAKLAKRLIKSKNLTLAVRDLANKNSLLSLSVFWAAKKIQEQEFSDARQDVNDHFKGKKSDKEKEESLSYFMTGEGKKVLNTRLKANKTILTAALDAAKELKTSYRETLSELEHMRDHDGEPIPFEYENPAPSIEDAESYFEKDNWGFPLIEARRILNGHPNALEISVASDVMTDCLDMRTKAVNKAIDEYDRVGKDKAIKYNMLIEKAHKEGMNQKGVEPKERNFDQAFVYLEEAFDYDPDRPEAIWGLATTYHGLGDLESEKGNEERSKEFHAKSVEMYRELIEKYPENIRFQFELGLVLLRTGDGPAADKVFGKVFEETNEFDFFLKSLSKLYAKAGMKKEAAIAIAYYMEKFPNDPRGEEVLAEIT